MESKQPLVDMAYGISSSQELVNEVKEFMNRNDASGCFKSSINVVKHLIEKILFKPGLAN